MDENSDLLRPRHLVAECLEATLNDLYGKDNVTELLFCEVWRGKIASHGELTPGGWYDPPPGGMAVLFGHANDSFSRLNFKSFRDEVHHPSLTTIDWRLGAATVYCSNIGLETGIPADFATTIYFGRDKNVINYIIKGFEVTRGIAETVRDFVYSRDLFYFACGAFKSNGMSPLTYSSTDAAGANIGHTLPVIELGRMQGPLDERTISTLRSRRQFLNGSEEWTIPGSFFTVEPQIRDLNGNPFPKLMLHYSIDYSKEYPVIGSECEHPYRWLGVL